MPIPSINFVVALPAEAKPLITHFGLKRQQPDGDFPIYHNKGITLVLSGVGKAAAATATQFLRGQEERHNEALWLNVGIAGHASKSTGTPILAQQVTDEETGQAWKVPFGFEPPCSKENLITLAQPEFDYDRPCAFDMEAAGFFATACEITAPGLAHCFKVISDNRDNPGRGISGKTVSQLIKAQLETLDLLLERINKTDINTP